jgi:glycosyltransferase involved in cell wall biosynthesis
LDDGTTLRISGFPFASIDLHQQLKIIVNCGPCERWIGKCIRSLRSQSFKHWEACVTVDPCGDRTLMEAIAAKNGDQRVSVHANQQRLYSTANLARAIPRSGAKSNDIIVQLDGDDWLNNRHALQIIVETYRRTDCWLTYGSWISSIRAAELNAGPNGNGSQFDWPRFHGRWPAYPESTRGFRQYEWLATSLRTWRKWLWDLIDDADLRDQHGNYFTVAQDHAIMFPMLEMSGTERARHVSDVLMVYNVQNPNRCEETQPIAQIENAIYLRNRKSYKRVGERVFPSNGHGASRLDRRRRATDAGA